MEIIKSRKFKIAAVSVGVLILMLVSFAGGIAVGVHKARFSENFGKNYERNFMGSRDDERENYKKGGMMGRISDQFEGRGFRNAHGLAGTIISITDNNIVINDQDNKENTVAVGEKTIIKNGRDDWKISDLKTGDRLVIMGNPGDNGVVNATLIRVFASEQK